jgi:hypothetical protein
MKIFSGLNALDEAGRQKAQGCLATNLAVPGLGSLVGGRKVGVLQIALYLSGFVITICFGLRFVYWSLAHWSEYHGPNADTDPLKTLHDLWQHARWPFLGVAMCGLAWFWAMATSRSLFAESKSKNAAGPDHSQ